jgi:hypothetical protein
MPENKSFSALVREALATDPNWQYGTVLPLAKEKKTGEYSPALPGMIRDYLTGWADLITGPEVGQNLSSEAVASMMGVPGQAANSLNVVIGPRARGFNIAKAFKSPFDEADDVLRNTIDDSTAQFKPNDYPADTRLELPDVIDHPELFAAYPELRNAGLEFSNNLGNAGGSFSPGQNMLRIKALLPENEQMGIGLHELQHWIQTHEGMNLGDNPANFLPGDFKTTRGRVQQFARDNMKDGPLAPELKEELSNYLAEFYRMDNDAYELYKMVPGEAEARAVQNKFLADIEPYTPSSNPRMRGFTRNEPYPDLPPPYNYSDVTPTLTQAFDPRNRQQYSPSLAMFAKLLEEGLKK